MSTEISSDAVADSSAEIVNSENASASDKHAGKNWPSQDEEEKIEDWTILTMEECISIEDAVRSASASPVSQFPDSMSPHENMVGSSDEEPNGDNTDAFVPLDGQFISLQHIKNPSSSINTATGFRALKRTISQATEAVSDEISARINEAAQGMDAPAIADNIIGPLFRIPEKFSAFQRVGARKYRQFDNLPAPRLPFLKRHRSDPTEPDYEATAIIDARRIFAGKMAEQARKAIVAQGICDSYQVIFCQHLHYDLEIALVGNNIIREMNQANKLCRPISTSSGNLAWQRRSSCERTCIGLPANTASSYTWRPSGRCLAKRT